MQLSQGETMRLREYHFPVCYSWMNFPEKKAKYKLTVLPSLQLSRFSSAGFFYILT